VGAILANFFGLYDVPMSLWLMMRHRTGTAKGAPAIVGLRTYPVKVEDDVVYLDIG
jgi:hypothetical protein